LHPQIHQKINVNFTNITDKDGEEKWTSSREMSLDALKFTKQNEDISHSKS